MNAGYYFIKPTYTARESVIVSSIPPKQNVIYQPHVYQFASYLAERYTCSHIIDIGCGRADKLVELHPKYQLVGIDLPEHIEYCKRQYPFGDWLAWNVDQPGIMPIEPQVMKNAVVVCADVVEHLLHPENLIDTLKQALEYVPVALLTTPDRDLVHGYEHNGPPANPSHIREWNLRELHELLEASGIRVEFAGYTYNNTRDYKKATSLFVLANHHRPPITRAPSNFRVVTFLSVYNEDDVLEAMLKHLIEQGSEVYVIDDWSTDNSAAIAETFLNKGVIKVDRYPPEKPWGEFRKLDQLSYVEKLSQEIHADWFILCDADEIRQSPWHGVTLRDAIYHVDQCGFNCIDHMVLTFRPVDELPAQIAFHQHMLYYELGRNPGFFKQRKAWKNLKQPVNLSDSLGHDVKFAGRKIYPYKFLLKHYPIRGQAHGERKVFVERRPRVAAETKEKGFSGHYKQINAGYDFLYNYQHLDIFAQKSFDENYLVERLSSVGIKPYPFPLPPKEVPYKWVEEMRQPAPAQGVKNQDHALQEAQNRILELEGQLHAIYKTKGWHLLNGWWHLKQQILRFMREQTAP